MFSPVLAGGCAASTCCRATPHDLTGHKLEPVKSSIVRSRFRLKALLRADAKRRCSASWDRESRAVAALRPAGYSSGRGDCARGGCSARRWGSLAGGGCLSCAGRAVLSECPAFDHACLCGFLAVSYVRSRLLFAALRQTGRLAGCCVPIPPWVEIANSAFSWCRCGYLPWRVHFGFVRFFMAIPTGYRDVGNGVTRGTGLAARRLCVFAQSHWPCNAFRGEYAGAARPRLRQRVFDSLDSPQGLAE